METFQVFKTWKVWRVLLNFCGLAEATGLDIPFSRFDERVIRKTKKELSLYDKILLF
jgi:hypothetical protein